MTQELRGIIFNYYTELQNAFKTGSIDSTKLSLAENAVLTSPAEYYKGKQAILYVLHYSTFLVAHFDIHYHYFDRNSSCCIATTVTKFPKVEMATTQWIVVKKGEIVEINHLYDLPTWKRFLQMRQKNK